MLEAADCRQTSHFFLLFNLRKSGTFVAEALKNLTSDTLIIYTDFVGNVLKKMERHEWRDHYLANLKGRFYKLREDVTYNLGR